VNVLNYISTIFKFDDPSQEIIIDTSSEKYWIGADKVSSYWRHKEGFSKE